MLISSDKQTGKIVFVIIRTNFLDVKLTTPFGMFISSLIQGKLFTIKPRYSTLGKSFSDFKTVHNKFWGFYFYILGVDLYKKAILM